MWAILQNEEHIKTFICMTLSNAPVKIKTDTLSNMPVCKAEAHRALELLEDYYSRLDDSEEKELKAAIERVIKIFKSRLFQALLDIQEFYELTLMDDGKSNAIKVDEAKEMASRWEIGQVRQLHLQYL